MSNEAFTAYDIDSFGKETVMDNLIVNNYDDTWYDKANKTKGKLANIVINFGIAANYPDAYRYIKGFVALIPAWRSENKGKVEQNQKGLEYKDFVKEHIFKLQTFALMTKEYFMNNKYGQHYIENFDFSELIVDDEFTNYFLAQQPLEVQRQEDKIKQPPMGRAYVKNLRELSRQMNEQLKSLEDMVSNIEMKQFMKEDQGYE